MGASYVSHAIQRAFGIAATICLLAGLIGLAPTANAATGTVVAWGGRSNDLGQTKVPAGLSGVTAIAAGYLHSVALKSDGTVVAWGDDRYGQTDVPAGLSHVTAIAANGYYSLALKADGTVVAWGTPFSDVPSGLSNVTAIAAGEYHSSALKDDGTVVAWGSDDEGNPLDFPAGIANVTAISAGKDFGLALRKDGTIVAWGYDGFGQTEVPPGLSGVTAIAASGSGYHALALVGAHAVKCTIVGTSRSEDLHGTGGADTICGRSGNDTIYAGNGADAAYGNRGNDTLVGGAGRDRPSAETASTSSRGRTVLPVIGSTEATAMTAAWWTRVTRLTGVRR